MLNKFLIIQTASIGDVILATPLIEKLHLFYPEAQIDVLVRKGNQDLFLNHPFIRNILIWNKIKHKKRNFLWTLYDIRKNHYDAVINLQRFFSTGILAAFSGAKLRIGFNKNPLSLCFTSKIPHVFHEGIHEIDRNLNLIKELTDDTRIKPKIYPSNTDFKNVSNYTKSVYYTISPGSIYPTKHYPSKKWVEFISQINKDVTIIFLGSEADNQNINKIIRLSGHPKSINMAGHLSFLESAAVMKNAKMNFTNDSAPMHLASAVNAPVTAIFLSTIPAFGFGPLSDQSYIVENTKKLKCRPCGLHGLKSCPKGHFKCAYDIDVSQLTEHL